MGDQRITRLMGFGGLAILVLLFLGFGPVGGKTPAENASGASVVAYFNAHPNKVWLSIYLVGAAIAVMVFYASALREALRNASGDQKILPNAAFAGGLLLVAGLTMAGLTHSALQLASHNNQAGIAHTLNFIDQNNELPFLFGAAVTAIAAGLSILTGSTLPKWLGWLSLVVGVACVAGPISFIGLIAFGVWLVITGFLLASRSKAPKVASDVGVAA